MIIMGRCIFPFTDSENLGFLSARPSSIALAYKLTALVDATSEEVQDLAVEISLCAAAIDV